MQWHLWQKCDKELFSDVTQSYECNHIKSPWICVVLLNFLSKPLFGSCQQAIRSGGSKHTGGDDMDEGVINQ